MRYTGTSGEYHSFPRMTAIRTVLWVLTKTGSNDNMIMLGDSAYGNTYNLHPNGRSGMWHAGYADSSVIAGTTKING